MFCVSRLSNAILSNAQTYRPSTVSVLLQLKDLISKNNNNNNTYIDFY